MKWIKFSDMMPPVGMYVFVVADVDVAIIKWKKEYEINDSEYTVLFYNTGTQSKRIFALDFWSPVSFFEEHLPKLKFEEHQGDLDPHEDWYLENKNNPDMDKIKEITEDLAAKTDEELRKRVQTEYGSYSYGGIKLDEVSALFEEINFPGRNEREISLQEAAYERYQERLKDKKISKSD